MNNIKSLFLERSLEQLLLEDEADIDNHSSKVLNSNDDLFHRKNSPTSPPPINTDELSWQPSSPSGDVEMITPPSRRRVTPRNSSSNPITVEDVDISPRTQRMLGGPPSNIYPPPEKIGNLQVPAFTTKVDYSEVPLRRTEGRA